MEEFQFQLMRKCSGDITTSFKIVTFGRNCLTECSCLLLTVNCSFFHTPDICFLGLFQVRSLFSKLTLRPILHSGRFT